MIGVKQEFYSNLRDEYSKKGTTSFLYRYMEQEKNKLFLTGEKNLQNGKRGDAYLQIKAYERALKEEAISETQYLASLLQMLLKGDKLRLKKESRQIVFDLAEQIAGDTVLLGCKKESEKYEKVIAVLTKQELPGVSKEMLEKLTQELLECALSVDIQTFLYDVGYPVNANGKIGIARKKDRNLDMLTAYCKENKISLYTQNTGMMQSLSDEQAAEYRQLYKILQTSENLDVVIPIQTDPVTGAGLFIIGKNNISPKSEIYKKVKGNCCYACFFMDGLAAEDFNGISSFSWLINDEENTLCNLPDLEEALKWYLFFKADSLDDFKERNGKIPEGCPEELKKFFAKETEIEDEFYVSEEELAEVKEIFK